MRKSFHTLSGIVTDVMGHDPCNGNVYIFMNRARNRIKLLHWEAGGMVLYSKLLETGTFGKSGSFSKDDICEGIEWRDLVMIVEGIIESGDSRRNRLESLRRLRKENDALSGKVASLEQSLYWLRKKMFGRMSEKNLPLDPNQLSLFTGQEMSPDEKAELEEEVRKAEEGMTIAIRAREKPVRKPLDTSLLPVEEINLYPEGTTGEDGGLKDDFVEIGTEETLRLERIPEKVYIVKTIRHKVIRKSELKEKHPEERHILISPLPLVPVGKCMAGAY